MFCKLLFRSVVIAAFFADECCLHSIVCEEMRFERCLTIALGVAVFDWTLDLSLFLLRTLSMFDSLMLCHIILSD